MCADVPAFLQTVNVCAHLTPGSIVRTLCALATANRQKFIRTMEWCQIVDNDDIKVMLMDALIADDASPWTLDAFLPFFGDVNRPLNFHFHEHLFYVPRTALVTAIVDRKEHMAMYFIERGARLETLTRIGRSFPGDVLSCLMRHNAISNPTDIADHFYRWREYEHVDAMAKQYPTVESVRERKVAKTKPMSNDDWFLGVLVVCWTITVCYVL